MGATTAQQRAGAALRGERCCSSADDPLQVRLGGLGAARGFKWIVSRSFTGVKA